MHAPNSSGHELQQQLHKLRSARLERRAAWRRSRAERRAALQSEYELKKATLEDEFEKEEAVLDQEFQDREAALLVSAPASYPALSTPASHPLACFGQADAVRLALAQPCAAAAAAVPPPLPVATPLAESSTQFVSAATVNETASLAGSPAAKGPLMQPRQPTQGTAAPAPSAAPHEAAGAEATTESHPAQSVHDLEDGTVPDLEDAAGSAELSGTAAQSSRADAADLQDPPASGSPAVQQAPFEYPEDEQGPIDNFRLYKTPRAAVSSKSGRTFPASLLLGPSDSPMNAASAPRNEQPSTARQPVRCRHVQTSHPSLLVDALRQNEEDDASDCYWHPDDWALLLGSEGLPEVIQRQRSARRAMLAWPRRRAEARAAVRAALDSSSDDEQVFEVREGLPDGGTEALPDAEDMDDVLPAWGEDSDDFSTSNHRSGAAEVPAEHEESVSGDSEVDAMLQTTPGERLQQAWLQLAVAAGYAAHELQQAVQGLVTDCEAFAAQSVGPGTDASSRLRRSMVTQRLAAALEVATEQLAALRQRWQSQQLPKLEAKAYRVWTEGRSVFRRERWLGDLAHAREQLKAVAMKAAEGHATAGSRSEKQLRRQCSSWLEGALYNALEAQFKLRVSAQEEQPARPPPQSRMRHSPDQQAPQLVGDLTANQESDDEASSGASLSDSWLVSDEEEVPAHACTGEPGRKRSASVSTAPGDATLDGKRQRVGDAAQSPAHTDTQTSPGIVAPWNAARLVPHRTEVLLGLREQPTAAAAEGSNSAGQPSGGLHLASLSSGGEDGVGPDADLSMPDAAEGEVDVDSSAAAGQSAQLEPEQATPATLAAAASVDRSSAQEQAAATSVVSSPADSGTSAPSTVAWRPREGDEVEVRYVFEDKGRQCDAWRVATVVSLGIGSGKVQVRWLATASQLEVAEEGDTAEVEVGDVRPLPPDDHLLTMPRPDMLQVFQVFEVNRGATEALWFRAIVMAKARSPGVRSDTGSHVTFTCFFEDGKIRPVKTTQCAANKVRASKHFDSSTGTWQELPWSMVRFLREKGPAEFRRRRDRHACHVVQGLLPHDTSASIPALKVARVRFLRSHLTRRPCFPFPRAKAALGYDDAAIQKRLVSPDDFVSGQGRACGPDAAARASRAGGGRRKKGSATRQEAARAAAVTRDENNRKARDEARSQLMAKADARKRAKAARRASLPDSQIMAAEDVEGAVPDPDAQRLFAEPGAAIMQVKVPSTIAVQLKQHQWDGVRFLYKNIVVNHEEDQDDCGGCILAHSMGLGKSLQTILLLLLYHSLYRRERSLLLVPKNVIENWVEEAKKWLPAPGAAGYNPAGLTADKVIKYQNPRDVRRWHSTDSSLLVVSFATFSNLVVKAGQCKRKKKAAGDPAAQPPAAAEESAEAQAVRAAEVEVANMLTQGPAVVVVDEAHELRNRENKFNQAAARIKTLRRIALTGYPLQNRLDEYHAMLDWALPGYMGDVASFKENFVAPVTAGQKADATQRQVHEMNCALGILQDLTSEVIHRRGPELLTGQLPAKQEHVLLLRLTPVQLALYKLFLERTEKDGTQLFRDAVFLSNLCNRPAHTLEQLQKLAAGQAAELPAPDADDEAGDIPLLVPAAPAEPAPGGAEAPAEQEAVRPAAIGKRQRTTKPIAQGLAQALLDLNARLEAEGEAGLGGMTTGKGWALEQLLQQCRSAGEKLVIFSERLQNLEAVALQLQQLGWKDGQHFTRIIGQTDAKSRQAAINKFNTDASVQVFLLSTRAGSLGINLIAACRMVVLDEPWNPVHNAQAVARIYRYGQRRETFVYRLLYSGTVEHRIYRRNVDKEALSKRVIDHKHIKGSNTLEDVNVYRLEEPQAAQPAALRAKAVGTSDSMLAALLRADARRCDGEGAQQPWLVAVENHQEKLLEDPTQKLTRQQRAAAAKLYETREAAGAEGQGQGRNRRLRRLHKKYSEPADVLAAQAALAEQALLQDADAAASVPAPGAGAAPTAAEPSPQAPPLAGPEAPASAPSHPAAAAVEPAAAATAATGGGADAQQPCTGTDVNAPASAATVANAPTLQVAAATAAQVAADAAAAAHDSARASSAPGTARQATGVRPSSVIVRAAAMVQLSAAASEPQAGPAEGPPAKSASAPQQPADKADPVPAASEGTCAAGATPSAEQPSAAKRTAVHSTSVPPQDTSARVAAAVPPLPDMARAGPAGPAAPKSPGQPAAQVLQTEASQPRPDTTLGQKPLAAYCEPISRLLDAYKEAPTSSGSASLTDKRLGYEALLAFLRNGAPGCNEDSLQQLDAALRGFEEATRPILQGAAAEWAQASTPSKSASGAQATREVITLRMLEALPHPPRVPLRAACPPSPSVQLTSSAVQGYQLPSAVHSSHAAQPVEGPASEGAQALALPSAGCEPAAQQGSSAQPAGAGRHDRHGVLAQPPEPAGPNMRAASPAPADSPAASCSTAAGISAAGSGQAAASDASTQPCSSQAPRPLCVAGGVPALPAKRRHAQAPGAQPAAKRPSTLAALQHMAGRALSAAGRQLGRGAAGLRPAQPGGGSRLQPGAGSALAGAHTAGSDAAAAGPSTHAGSQAPEAAPAAASCLGPAAVPAAGAVRTAGTVGSWQQLHRASKEAAHHPALRQAPAAQAPAMKREASDDAAASLATASSGHNRPPPSTRQRAASAAEASEGQSGQALQAPQALRSVSQVAGQAAHSLAPRGSNAAGSSQGADPADLIDLAADSPLRPARTAAAPQSAPLQDDDDIIFID